MNFDAVSEIHVTEAYGRSYNELHEARTAWHKNLTFRIVAFVSEKPTPRRMYIDSTDAVKYAPNATITWVDRYGHELGVLA